MEGVDKIGHTTTSFQLSTIQSDILKLRDIKKQSAIISSLTRLAI